MRWRESKPLTRAQVYLSLAVASMAISVGLLGVLSQELLMRSAYSLGRMSIRIRTGKQSEDCE